MSTTMMGLGWRRQHFPDIKMTARKKRAASIALWVTYINIALYAACYQLQTPVEPFLVQSLVEHRSSGDHDENDDANLVRKRYGQLQSFFSIIQTLGSPLVGVLLDRCGVRIASALVFGASALSYAVLSHAHSMQALFWSKVPTILQHAFLVAQAIAATSTAAAFVEAEITPTPGAANNAEMGEQRARAAATRSQALGRMTTAYTIGATIGPALGGHWAARGNLYLGAHMAMYGSLASVVLSWLFLPDARDYAATRAAAAANMHTDDDAKPKADICEVPPSFWQQARKSWTVARLPAMALLLLVKVVSGVSSSMYSTAFPLIVTQDLHFTPDALGWCNSGAMLAVALLGAVGMAPLTREFGSATLCRASLALRAFLGIVLATIVSVAAYQETAPLILHQVVSCFVTQAVATHALATSLTTQTTGAVSAEDQGSLLGIEHGLFSLARIVGPPLSALLLTSVPKQFAFGSVAVASGAVDLTLVALLMLSSRSGVNSPTGKSKSD